MYNKKDLFYSIKYRDNLNDLNEYIIQIFDYLNLEPINILFRDIEEEGRYYIKENYIVVSNKLTRNKIELLKTISHEARHYYQLTCVNQKNNNSALVKLWRNELKTDSTKDIAEEDKCALLELDAYSFSKFILKELFDIKFEYSDSEYNDLVNWYINKFF